MLNIATLELAEQEAANQKLTVTEQDIDTERNQTLAAIVHHMTDNLVVLGLLYALEPDFISNRLDGVTPVTGENARATWNAYAWELKS